METFYKQFSAETIIDNIKNEFYKELDLYYKDKKWNTLFDNQKYEQCLVQYIAARDSKSTKTSHQYYLLKHYSVMKVGEDDKLVPKLKNIDDVPLTIVTKENLFDILLKAHYNTGHGRRDKMHHELKIAYDGIKIDHLILFLKFCKECATIKARRATAGIVVKPILSDHFDARMQIDLVDMQSTKDNEYCWILNAQNHFTKYVHLKALKSKRAAEVALRVFEIFIDFGAPLILQSDNGREFVAEIITELKLIWPELKLVHGAVRKPSTQGSVERANFDVKKLLGAWMRDNQSTRWTFGLKFVQQQKNRSYIIPE